MEVKQCARGAAPPGGASPSQRPDPLLLFLLPPPPVLLSHCSESKGGAAPLEPPAPPGAFPSQRLSVPRALAPASIKTSSAQPHQISKNRRAGQTHLSSRGNRRKKVAAGLDLLASESAGPKPGRRGWRHLFNHIGGRREARTKSLYRSVHQPVRKQRRAKLEN